MPKYALCPPFWPNMRKRGRRACPNMCYVPLFGLSPFLALCPPFWPVPLFGLMSPFLACPPFWPYVPLFGLSPFLVPSFPLKEVKTVSRSMPRSTAFLIALSMTLVSSRSDAWAGAILIPQIPGLVFTPNPCIAAIGATSSDGADFADLDTGVVASVSGQAEGTAVPMHTFSFADTFASSVTSEFGFDVSTNALTDAGTKQTSAVFASADADGILVFQASVQPGYLQAPHRPLPGQPG